MVIKKSLIIPVCSFQAWKEESVRKLVKFVKEKIVIVLVVTEYMKSSNRGR